MSSFLISVGEKIEDPEDRFGSVKTEEIMGRGECMLRNIPGVQILKVHRGVALAIHIMLHGHAMHEIETALASFPEGGSYGETKGMPLRACGEKK